MECFNEICGNGEDEVVGVPEDNLVVVKIPPTDFSEPKKTTEIVVKGDVSPCEFCVKPELKPELKPEFDSNKLTCNEFPRRSSKLSEFVEAVPAESVRNSF